MRGAIASGARRHASRTHGFLSLFPAILLVLAVTGMVGGDRAFDRFVALLHAALPEVASGWLQRLVAGVRRTPHPGLLSAGVALHRIGHGFGSRAPFLLVDAWTEALKSPSARRRNRLSGRFP